MTLRLLLLVLVLFGALLVNLCFGSVPITLPDAWQAITDPSKATDTVRNVLFEIRLPRLLCAFQVGSALAVSGYLLQSLSRNYLADPFLTGVSSGAAVAMAFGILLNVPITFLPVAALLGGLITSLLVATMARTSNGLSVTRLLLSGIAISALSASVITIAMTNLASAGRVQGLYYWLAGSVSGKTWSDLQSASIYIGVGLAAALLLSKPLRLLGLGAESATSLGMNVPVMQSAILFSAVILCGAAVSLSGIVGFVGLIAPYIARSQFGDDQRLNVFTSACVGGILVLVSDLAARTALQGQELPLSTLLSLIGAPFFLWLVLKHKDES